MGTVDELTGTWLLLTAGEDRAHAGNEGYDDDPSRWYSWDDTVPNSAKLSIGDIVAIWDTHVLIGTSVIERITSGPQIKKRNRCPNCAATKFKARKRRAPRYKCDECKTEFDVPISEDLEVTSYRAYYEASWVASNAALRASELRDLCENPLSQHSLRRLRRDDFLRALGLGTAEVLQAGVRLIRTGLTLPGGHRIGLTRLRVGQGEFRLKMLDTYGDVCAFTGSSPVAALEAAHLYSYAVSGVHHENGGLLLRRDVHRLFDLGDIAVNPRSRRIDIRSGLDTYAEYEGLAGRELRVDLVPRQLRWIDQHWALHRAS